MHPIAFKLGPLEVHWYGVFVAAGFLAGLWSARKRAARQGISADTIVDLSFWILVAALVGARTLYVITFWRDEFEGKPISAIFLQRSGLVFYGGLIGAVIAMMILARMRKVSALALFDVAAIVAPIGLFFGRIANFINGELWGRPTDVAWAMVFPRADSLPRHPSQLYEAGLEGLLILIVVSYAVRKGGLKHAGFLSGLFGVLYALTRSFAELFRDPDPVTEALSGGLTMGMVLSLPMALVGIWLGVLK